MAIGSGYQESEGPSRDLHFKGSFSAVIAVHLAGDGLVGRDIDA
jgi:hypothetical protein